MDEVGIGTRPSFAAGRRPLRRVRIAHLVALFVVAAALYSIVIPPFETPDEIWHFAFIHHVADGNGLPVSEAGSQAFYRQQGVQAPAYYLAAALLTAAIDQDDFAAIYARANPHRAIGEPNAAANRNYLIHHDDEHWPWRGTVLALHISRFLSVALGALAVWATYRTLLLILGHDGAIVGTAAIAFVPQFLFISAAASNDNAVNALAACLLWQLVAMVVPRAQSVVDLPGLRRRLLGVGALLGLAILSKLSALGLVGLTGLTVLWVAWRARTWRLLWEAALWIGLPAVAIAGWWYVRNWLLYADPLAWNIWEANILLRVDEADWRVVLSELGSLERSFWGLFGWLNLSFPDWVYDFFRAVEILIGAGLALATGRWIVSSRRVDRRWLGAGLLILWLLILSVSWLRFMRIAPAAQGRYFFPALPSLALLAAIGIRAWRIWTLDLLIPIAIVLVGLLAPFWIIGPAYQPPASHRVGQELTAVEADFGSEIVLTGIRYATDTLLPGDLIEVTTAWRAMAQPQNDYSIFLHLVDTDGLIVAQYDSMPGGGLLPTSQWLPGREHLESFALTVPETAYTPNRVEWRLGLYDAYSGERLSLTTGDGEQSVEDAFHYGELSIETPPGSAPNSLSVAFEDNVTLAGYTLSSRVLSPGDELTVTLYWRAAGPVEGAYTVFVHLLDADYQTRGGDDDEPPEATNGWSPDRLVEDSHSFQVAGDAPAGIYQLEIGLYAKPELGRLLLKEAPGAQGADRLLLGPLQVTDPNEPDVTQ